MTEETIQNINIDLIIPNRYQPREVFDEKSLNELASSIKIHGVIQPILLKKTADKYEIIAGERRYKASIIAGLTTIPAIVANLDDKKSAELSIIENVQRKGLSAIEEARSFKKILDKGKITQDELANRLGLSQSSIANKLRLLNLSSKVQDALLFERISERHARSLLSVPLDKQEEILQKIINERLTVKDLDDYIKSLNIAPNSEIDNLLSKIDNQIKIQEVLNKPLEEEKNVESIGNDTNIFNVSSGANIFDNIENSKENITNEPVNSIENNNLNFNPFASNTNSNIFDDNSLAVNELVEEPKKEDNLFNNQNIEKDNVLTSDNTIPLNNDVNLVQEEKVDNINKEIPKEQEKEQVDSYKTLFNIFNNADFKSLEDEKANLNMTDEESVLEESKLEEEPIIKVVTKEIVKKQIVKDDLNSVKLAFNNLVNEAKEAGFDISIEDYDFADLYQVVVKVNK